MLNMTSSTTLLVLVLQYILSCRLPTSSTMVTLDISPPHFTKETALLYQDRAFLYALLSLPWEVTSREKVRNLTLLTLVSPHWMTPSKLIHLIPSFSPLFNSPSSARAPASLTVFLSFLIWSVSCVIINLLLLLKNF